METFDGETAVVVLAAGQGTRMKSKLQKVLHPVLGLAMVEHVLRAVAVTTESRRTVLVVGRQAEQVRERLGARVEYAQQSEQLGTGHAVLQSRPLLQDDASVKTVLVVYGDTPLLRDETLQALLSLHRRRRATLTMLTAEAQSSAGYGRILRDEQGRIRGIVEEASATPEQKEIREINSGVYCFRAEWLWPNLDHLPLSPKGEYYLTDLVALAVEQGEVVEAAKLAEETEALGVNDRVQLAYVERLMRERVLRRLMLSGVTVIDPATSYVEATVTVGQDTVIHPNTYLRGQTRIGADCQVGPGTVVDNSIVGDRCRLFASVLEGATVEDDVVMGPFCHLRPGAHLATGVEMGNYAEVKMAYLGPRTKMHHFSYVGDATFGADVNVGAGTITCNYDSETKTKNQTIVEDGVGLGSDTLLVAPVRLGARSTTGAGSVVTHDLPPDSVAFGVPATVKRKRRAAGEEPSQSGGVD